MKNFKNRDRPKKIISVIAFALICILAIGFIYSAFGVSGSSSFLDLGNVTIGGGGIASTEGVSSTFTLLNSQTFDPRYGLIYNSGDEPINRRGFVRLDDTCIRFGAVDTTKGYFEFKASEEDAGVSNSSKLAFYLHPQTWSAYEESLLDMSKFDILTLDFDIWTNGSFPDLFFDFNPSSSFYSELTYKMSLHRNSRTGKLEFVPLSSRGGYIDIDEYKYVIDSPKEPMHITYVVQTIGMNVAQFVFFVNGVRVYSGNFLSGVDLMTFCIMIDNQEIGSLDSICIDNFQVCTYGNENVVYSGDLAGDIDSLEIVKCCDWIYYDTYNSTVPEGLNDEAN